MVTTDTNPSDIRVWIIASNDTDFLTSVKFGGRLDDIILQFNQQIDGISLIGGYQRRRLNLPRQITPALSSSKLKELFGERHKVIESTQTASRLQLSGNDWSTVRAEIVGLSNDLANTVVRLEELQNKPKELADADALLFDMFWTSVQLFQPTKAQELNKLLKDVRGDIQQATQKSDDFATSATAMLNAFSGHEGIVPVDTATAQDKTFGTLQRFVSELRPPRMDEESVIYRDNSVIDPDFERGQSHLSVEYQSYATRLVDLERNRELFVFLAHKRGLESKDVLGADFIYVSRFYHSFAFVQYKVPEDDKQIYIGNRGTKAKNRKQLEEMLQACRQASSCIADANIQSIAFRLGSCPFFYKITDHIPRISETSNVVDGSYIQACLVNCLLSENEVASLDLAEHLAKSITYRTFVELVKKGQAGSVAETYSAIFDHARAHMKDDILFFALEMGIGEALVI